MVCDKLFVADRNKVENETCGSVFGDFGSIEIELFVAAFAAAFAADIAIVGFGLIEIVLFGGAFAVGAALVDFEAVEIESLAAFVDVAALQVSNSESTLHYVALCFEFEDEVFQIQVLPEGILCNLY